jgi:hypothetical protein
VTDSTVPVPSPDPVREAKAYQDLLVGLVGNDDPAAVQAATPARIRQLLTHAAALLTTRPAPGEWSVLECVAHILDAELVASGRYRWILAHDEPDLVGYDQDRWVDRLHQPVEGGDELLALFEPLRAANLTLWRRTPEVERERIGLHRERGPESYRLTFVLIAGHDRLHLGQAERALRAISG